MSTMANKQIKEIVMGFAVRLAGVVLAGVGVLSGCSTLTGDGVQSAVAMACGQLDIAVAYGNQKAGLTVADEHYVLNQVEAASGAKYQGQDDPSIQLWNKGDRALLSVGDRRWPECVRKGALAEPFLAQGNEPSWQVSVDGGQLTLTELGRSEPLVADYSVSASSERGQTLTAEGAGRTIVMDTAPQLCRDSMAEMVYPSQVRLTVDGDSRQGCGGDPQRLLQGVEWVVEDINHGGIIDSSRITINFLPEGRVAGRASCNNYMGSYQLTGEGLSFGQAASTMMACAPALMNQERAFLQVLAEVNSFDINPTGALILNTADGRSLRAYGSQSLRP